MVWHKTTYVHICVHIVCTFSHSTALHLTWNSLSLGRLRMSSPHSLLEHYFYYPKSKVSL